MKSTYDYVKSKPEIIQNASRKQVSWNNWSTGQDDVANYCYRIIKFYNCIDYCQCYDCDYVM